jgi:hypothetical protein
MINSKTNEKTHSIVSANGKIYLRNGNKQTAFKVLNDSQKDFGILYLYSTSSVLQMLAPVVTLSSFLDNFDINSLKNFISLRKIKENFTKGMVEIAQSRGALASPVTGNIEISLKTVPTVYKVSDLDTNIPNKIFAFVEFELDGYDTYLIPLI